MNDIVANSYLVAQNLAIVLAANGLIRVIADISGPGAGMRRGVLTGLVLGVLAVLSARISATTTGIDFEAQWILVLMAAPLAGRLAGLLCLLVTAAAQLWLDSDGALFPPYGPLNAPEASALAGFAPSVELYMLLALGLIGLAFVQMIGNRVSRNGPGYLSSGALALVGGAVLGALSVKLGAEAGQDLTWSILTAIVNLLPGTWLLLLVWRNDRARITRASALSFAQVAVDQAPDGLIWMEGNGKIIYCNAMACRLLGFSHEELMRRYLRDIDHNPGDQKNPTHRLLSGGGRWPKLFDAPFLSKSGNAVALALAANLVDDEGRRVICMSLRPGTAARPATPAPAPAAAAIGTEAPQAEGPSDARLVPQLTPPDRLTGLRDRNALAKAAIDLIPKVRAREVDNLTIGVVDMDDMNGFNDRRGYAMGDALLATYARILRQNLRADDRAFRLEEDSFAVLMPGRGEGAFDYLHKRFDTILASVQDAGFPDASASVGFACFSETDCDFERTLELAAERLKRRKPSYLRSRARLAVPNLSGQ